jgi:class 3 adenylate cyclase
VRTAVLCQEAIARLRSEGATEFQMGVSIHHGRVYVARFIVDADSHQLTVIGRNVNLAGRLSSAAKKPGGEETTRLVSVDAEGVLVNEGIALSRAALVQLENEIDIDSRDGRAGRVLEWDDDEIGGRICLRYAGDARFKGVEASFPVFEVGHE